MAWWQKNKPPFITDTDKTWVHENFSWLIEAYGYPIRSYKPVLFTSDFFPESFSNSTVNAANIISDLCELLSLDKSKISFSIEKDLRDEYGIAFRSEGYTEIQLEKKSVPGGYTYAIFIPSFLENNPQRLMYELLYYFIMIRLIESIDEIDKGEDFPFFVYLAAIYMGFGVLIAQTMMGEGKQTDGFWETKWGYGPMLPLPIIAYALALYSSLTDEKDPHWKNLLPIDLQNLFTKAADLIWSEQNPFFNKQSLDATELYAEGNLLYEQKDYNKALEVFRKALFKATEPHIKADLSNIIGYTFLRLGEYEKSIPNFHRAIELDPDYGYAYDNLGFAYILSGDLDTGKHYLTLALQTKNNDPAYSYRNLALYHQQRKEMELAEKFFKKSFETEKMPVDLLEYFYARFLIDLGNYDEGMNFLKQAVRNGEPEAVLLFEKINNKSI